MDFHWSDFIAGCFGGIGGTFVGHPIDTIKVRQQTHPDGFLSARRCLELSLKHEGPTGLFKGLSSPLSTAALVNATFFGVYGNTIKLLQNGKQSDALPGYQTVAIAGMVAGTAQLLVNCPVELTKIKLQVAANGGNLRPYKGPIDCLVSLYKLHGIRSWYKGLVAMFWRDGPSYGLYMVLYEWLSRGGKNYSKSPIGDSFVTLIAGGVTGAVTWVSVLPIDVVKSRIQADCPNKPKYRGMIDCVRVSYREEGWPVFFRGFYAIALRALIVNAATFLVYETALWHLSKQ